MDYANQYRPQTASDDECFLISSLLKAEGAFLSGSALAKTLEVSRTAVCQKIKKLKADGFSIESSPRRGYRLTSVPDRLHPVLLRHAMGSNELDFLFYPEIDSTNSEAERQIANGREGSFAILSGNQTMGRGRRGRAWFSASPDNLYLTLTFEPQLPAVQFRHFTLWSGILLCRMLQRHVPAKPLQIKWPNDLYCEGRKFAGMLTEARMEADYLKTLFFGFGLNVNGSIRHFPEALRQKTTSLRLLTGEELPLNTIAAESIQAIERAYQHCINDLDTNELESAWAPLDFLSGLCVEAAGVGTRLTGTARGIDSSGALRIEDSAGKIHLVHAGDVTLNAMDSSIS